MLLHQNSSLSGSDSASLRGLKLPHQSVSSVWGDPAVVPAHLPATGANIAQLRLLAIDLLRYKRYVAAKLYDPNARLVESIVC